MPWTVKGRCTSIAGNGELIRLRFTYIDHQKREQTVSGSWMIDKWISQPPHRSPDWSGDQEVEITFWSRKEPAYLEVSFTHNGQPLRGKFDSLVWQCPPHAVFIDLQQMVARRARSTYRR